MRTYKIILESGVVIEGVKASCLIEGENGFYLYQKSIEGGNDFLVGFIPKTAILLWDNSESKA